MFFDMIVGYWYEKARAFICDQKLLQVWPASFWGSSSAEGKMDRVAQCALGAGVSTFFHPVAYAKVLIQVSNQWEFNLFL